MTTPGDGQSDFTVSVMLRRRAQKNRVNSIPGITESFAFDDFKEETIYKEKCKYWLAFY